MRSVIILILVLIAAGFGCKKKGAATDHLRPFVHKTDDGSEVLNSDCVRLSDDAVYCLENNTGKICDDHNCLELPTPAPVVQ